MNWTVHEIEKNVGHQIYKRKNEKIRENEWYGSSCRMRFNYLRSFENWDVPDFHDDEHIQKENERSWGEGDGHRFDDGMYFMPKFARCMRTVARSARFWRNVRGWPKIWDASNTTNREIEWSEKSNGLGLMDSVGNQF